VLSGFNDFYTLNPDSPLLREWSKKPSNLKPTQVVTKSNKTITWVCKVNHEWEARLNERLRGSGCPYCANKKILLGYNDLPTTHPDLASQWSTKNLTPASEVTSGSEVKAWWMGACGHEWQAPVYKRTKGQGCPVCRDYVSTPEKELASHLTKLGVKVIKSDRKILKGRELDLYLPDVKIAIEYNGLYWHTEDRGKTRWYHHAKWEDCKQQGIQLIQIWEDDWNRNPELVKRMIDRKIGISKEKTVYARTCEVVQVTIQESQAFMEENHIQGWTNGSSYLALKPKGSTNIVALLIVKKEPGTSGKVLNIMRYATSCKVPGGFSKLLKAAEQLWKPEKVITFSDNTVSTGELYAKTGFVADKILEPDYQYLAGGVRKHKFGYRLKKFREDPTLQYVEGLTERELALLNNLPRIWDAGKTRWSKTVSL
jgi:hypothetical protein